MRPRMAPASESAVPTRPRPGVLRMFRWLGPDYTVLLVFALLFVVLAFVYGARWNFFNLTIFGALGMAAVFVGGTAVMHARRLWRREPGAIAYFKRRSLEVTRDFGPFIGLMLVYEHLYMYTGVIRQGRIDASLMAADITLFGVEPTLWIGKVAHPVLTDIFAVAYASYFPMPLFLCLVLQLRGRRHDFQELVTAITVAFYTGFLGYLFFPAGPPRFYEPILPLFDPPILKSALGFFETSQATWDAANQVKVSASFPSMHCGLSMLTLIYAWRFRDMVKRRALLLGVFVVCTVTLWTSTIYLRHHWVVDCFAGWAVAFFAAFAAPRLRKAWGGGALED